MGDDALKTLLPYGMLATKQWLSEQGLSTHAIDNAVKRETLLSLATGVYSQYTRSLSWEGVVASLQRMEQSADDLPLTVVGGGSALALLGLSHYLPLGKSAIIQLYSPTKPPNWLSRLSLPFAFEAHSAKRLWPDAVCQDTAFLKQHEWSAECTPVFFSCAEKAMLEVLLDVPKKVSFEHAEELMQGLVNLSPGKLDQLLKVCKSVKVKRLFFWFAKRQHYPWFKKLNETHYDLGSGKRVIAQGGVLDNDYLITVPSHMVVNDGSF